MTDVKIQKSLDFFKEYDVHFSDTFCGDERIVYTLDNRECIWLEYNRIHKKLWFYWNEKAEAKYKDLITHLKLQYGNPIIEKETRWLLL